MPGVYAAGDLRVKNLRQVVTATADGAIAAVELERYASQMSERTGLVPPRPVDSAYERRERDAATSAGRSGTSPAPAPPRRGGCPGAASGADRLVPGQLQLSQYGRDRLGIMGAAGPVIVGLFGKKLGSFGHENSSF